jgi:hypothetical protein
LREKHDFGATTAVNLVWEKAKSKITPKVLWSAIGVLVGILGAAITGWVTTQSDIRGLEKTVARLESERAEAVAQRERDRELLNKIDKAVGEVGVKLDNIADEVDRQREEWDHVHGIAESPPHAARRRH